MKVDDETEKVPEETKVVEERSEHAPVEAEPQATIAEPEPMFEATPNDEMLECEAVVISPAAIAKNDTKSSKAEADLKPSEELVADSGLTAAPQESATHQWIEIDRKADKAATVDAAVEVIADDSQ